MSKVGRPRKEIDERVFSEAIKMPLLKSDIASLLGVSEDTLERWVRSNFDCTFSEIREQNRSYLKRNILIKQYEVAMSGDRTMLIWLGKNYCDQVDSVTNLHEFEEKRAKALSDEELKEAALKLIQKEPKSA